MHPERQKKKKFSPLTNQIKGNNGVDTVLSKNYERRLITDGKKGSG